jgi:ATP-binding cassette subfamily B protein
MKTLLHYLKPHKWLIIASLVLAAINQVFSLFAPAITGNILDQLVTHPHFFDKEKLIPKSESILYGTDIYHGAFYFLGLLIGTAMVSRIAKAFQDYAVNVITQKFGANIFTDGLQHSMALPYQEFEDQRSGETLSILTKVREDSVKFITNFINVFLGFW